MVISPWLVERPVPLHGPVTFHRPIPTEIHFASRLVFKRATLRRTGMEMWSCRIVRVFHDHAGPVLGLELTEISPVGFVRRVDVTGHVLECLVPHDNPLCVRGRSVRHSRHLKRCFFRIRTPFKRVASFALRDAWRETKGVSPGQRVVYVGGGVGRGGEAQRVRRGVARRLGVVVAEVVVVKSGFGVEVLAREAERRIGGAVRRPHRGAPEGAPGAPGDIALFVDEFGRFADQVRDDCEEAGVDLVLRGVYGRDAFRLGDRLSALVVPRQRDRVGEGQGRAGLSCLHVSRVVSVVRRGDFLHMTDDQIKIRQGNTTEFLIPGVDEVDNFRKGWILKPARFMQNSGR